MGSVQQQGMMWIDDIYLHRIRQRVPVLVKGLAEHPSFGPWLFQGQKDLLPRQPTEGSELAVIMVGKVKEIEESRDLAVPARRWMLVSVIGWQERCDGAAVAVLDEPERFRFIGALEYLEVVDAVVFADQTLQPNEALGNDELAVHRNRLARGDEWFGCARLEVATRSRRIEWNLLRLEGEDGHWRVGRK